MRLPALILVVVSVAAVQAPTAFTRTDSAGKAVLRIKQPAVGQFSVTGIVVSTKAGKQPRLRVIGKLAKRLVAVAGIAPDPKHKGRFVGAVVLVNRKVSTTRAVQLHAKPTPIVAIRSTDTGTTITQARIELLCNANVADTIRTLTVSNPTDVASVEILDAGLATRCKTRWGDYADAEAGSSFLNAFIDGRAPPSPLPPPPPANVICTTSLVNQGTPNEVISNTRCSGATFNGILFTPLGGNTISAFFPENGQAACEKKQDGSLYCTFNSFVSDSGPIDVRFGSPPSTSGAKLRIARSLDGGVTWQPTAWDATGP
jgi:hypothetical protein